MTARLQKLIVSLVMIAACVEGPVQTQPMSAHRDLGAVQDMGPGRSQDAVIAGSDAADTALQDLGLDLSVPPQEVQNGSWEYPFVIDVFPATLVGDTEVDGTSVVDVYRPCAPGTNESGPEVVYRFTAPADGVLIVSVDDVPGDDLDVDIHLLEAADSETCLARDDVTFSFTLQGGESYWLAVDSWFDGSRAKSGPFRVEIDFQPFSSGSCPAGMADRGDHCMDLYEAPNRLGFPPLVMYTLPESEAWCARRGKRLCYDDEWTHACAGDEGRAYPYGSTRQPGLCNDDKVWRTYQSSLIQAWPRSVSSPEVESLQELLTAARSVSSAAAESADHIEWLYQGESAGENPGCGNASGVYDLVGNVEEWTRRRSGATQNFSGSLKGRYWGESRTCQSGVTTHADVFRFYEIGFRCCLDR